MIEGLSKVTEVGQNTSDVKSTFDPDAKIAKREVSPSSEAKSSDKPYNPDDKVEKQENCHEVNEAKEKKGGSYKEMKDAGYGDYSEPPQEVHHMPADSASELPRDDGPAITMDKEDHRETASCGNSKEAQEYRAKQKELIEQGKFREALQMDIDDIHEKFGDKYDDAIKDMLEYVDKLEEEGRV